jgi:hypothetical protein
MGMHAKIPPQFEARAERRVWFDRQDAERFLGIELAEKGDDETWTLLADNLDLSRQTDNFEAVRRGRDFLRDYDGEGRMFEPVWEGTAE